MDISDNIQRTEDKRQDVDAFFFRCVSYAKACYMVSGIIKDIEPVKWEIRKMSNNLIEDINSFAYVQKRGGSSQAALLLAREKFSLLLTLFGVASLAGLVSKMNYEILKIEGEKILVNFDIFLGDYLKVGMLSSDFFANNRKGDRESLLLPSDIAASSQAVLINDLKSKNGNSEKRLGVENVKGISVAKNSGQSVMSDSVQRKDKILSFMKGKTRLSVTDIAGHIKDCSEKTIQRDLIEMVEKGIVQREGERRWSRYTIVS